MTPTTLLDNFSDLVLWDEHRSLDVTSMGAVDLTLGTPFLTPPFQRPTTHRKSSPEIVGDSNQVGRRDMDVDAADEERVRYLCFYLSSSNLILTGLPARENSRSNTTPRPPCKNKI